ncbi:MAG: class I SAM-dependent methyltransferase [Bacteroidetes bacterium]|nr:class I SAM-dependent methyltransferase [Bacteroidota bacterium]
MSSYIGQHAELYDLFYAGKDYRKEAAFIHQCIQKEGFTQSVEILELACGTGNHALELEKIGYRMLSTDYSPDMLKVAQSKNADKNISFQWMDMTAFNLGNKKFKVIICMFDSIGYVQTNENIIKVFDNVSRHLEEDGVFIFEFWNGGAFMKNYEASRTKTWDTENMNIVRVSETEIDYVNQLGKVSYTISISNKDKEINTIKEQQINRFFFIQEMKNLLNSGGLNPVQFTNGFELDLNIDFNSWHTVAVAKKIRK